MAAGPTSLTTLFGQLRVFLLGDQSILEAFTPCTSDGTPIAVTNPLAVSSRAAPASQSDTLGSGNLISTPIVMRGEFNTTLAFAAGVGGSVALERQFNAVSGGAPADATYYPVTQGGVPVTFSGAGQTFSEVQSEPESNVKYRLRGIGLTGNVAVRVSQ